MPKNFWRGISQAGFLVLFSFLLSQGRVRIWILLLIVGAVSSLVGKRVYCGWVCPIGGGMRFQSWLYEKFNLPRLKAPSFLKGGFMRLILVIAFFGGMVAVRVVGIELNIILYLFILGVGVSFIFSEDFWHRICPHGTVLNLTGRVGPLGMKVARADCTGCGLCEKVCPNESIEEEGTTGIRSIDCNECLVCHNCEEICPTGAISYGKRSKRGYQDEKDGCSLGRSQ
ncbi:4Fe-4S binding protein [Natroniella sulfidigena]|uniref:4Fe-4S binding protein n=1 Tax=Natroniella sulfidigena TaxID=723921 RepID=UPI00200AE282|nr:4Fe-4S dicluster domain-containing protein [Natroniella sulfidigena]MCK8817779.1 4Fe-4S binding protein [Natroniella sulfidigena]